MAVVCKRCGRQYDVTLFQFGRSITCDCGAKLPQAAEITLGMEQAEAEAAGVGYLTPATEQDLHVYLIRHGKTVWNKSGRIQGQTDVELSGEGRAESEKVAAALAAVKFEAAYSSDLRRCTETAEIILRGPRRGAGPPAAAGHIGVCSQQTLTSGGAFNSARRDVPLVKTDALREEDFGEWAGLTYPEIAQRWPEQCEERERDRLGSRPEGGESLGELQARVVAKMAEIAARYTRGNVLVVTHGGPAFVFFSHVMAPEGKLRGNFTVKNCAINIVSHIRFGWKLEKLNDDCHL
ncbi:MAG: histidine phosphatase family protein [Planctomycetota bacterium]